MDVDEQRHIVALCVAHRLESSRAEEPVCMNEIRVELIESLGDATQCHVPKEVYFEPRLKAPCLDAVVLIDAGRNLLVDDILELLRYFVARER